MFFSQETCQYFVQEISLCGQQCEGQHGMFPDHVELVVQYRGALLLVF